jgi:DNA replication protein DnaC
VPKTS